MTLFLTQAQSLYNIITNMKAKALLTVGIVFAAIGFLLLFDLFTSARFTKALREFTVVVSEANKESTEAKLRNVQMQQELDRNKAHIEHLVRMNNGLKSQLDRSVKALREKDRQLEILKKDFLRVQQELERIKAGENVKDVH